MNKSLGVNLTLLLIAVIWGAGFIPQKLGMDYVGPAAFNALRFALGALTLIPVMLIMRSFALKDVLDTGSFKLGLVLGFLLFAGALFQQISLQYTSVANVSFITGLYVIVVPLIGYFVGYRYGLIVWSGGVLAIIGLYLMTAGGLPGMLKGDLIALAGAVMWAIHLLVIAERAGGFNQIALSFIQFLSCAVLSLGIAYFFEDQILPTDMKGYLWPLINGVIVVGFAYTLQVLVMPHAEPFSASVILSLEAVFGAIAGYLVFDESKTMMALLGAVLMLCGCLLAQLQHGKKSLQETTSSRFS